MNVFVNFDIGLDGGEESVACVPDARGCIWRRRNESFVYVQRDVQ